MDSKRGVSYWLSLAIAISWAVSSLPSLVAAEDDSPPAIKQEQLSRQAFQLERQGQWSKACEVYEQILSRDRSLSSIKERYLACLRLAQQSRRHRDATYKQQALALPLARALDVYGEVLDKLRTAYVDRDKVECGRLFKQGLEELRLALNDAAFCREHLPAAKTGDIHAFQQDMVSTWGNRSVRRGLDAVSVARELALAARSALGLRPTLVVLELTCGACNALDEHTAYLTPGQLSEAYDSLKGHFVGVGIEVTLEDDKLTISHVIPGSPAEMAGLRSGDRLLRINGRPTSSLAAETAAELLRGEAATTIELEIAARGEGQPMLLKLMRQAVNVPSVSEARFLGERMLGIGYLQLAGFQETTLQELDDAILKLQGAGMRVLILDLRGNPGGLVDVAVGVAQRFLSVGVITTTQGQIRIYNKTYEAHNLNALAVPLVLLIDGETASSAEMVAGALKDNHRGRLIGQTTFGKGSIQHYWGLSSSAGLRITVAKFYSPRGLPYSGNGVTPHLVVERASMDMSMDIEQDPQVRAALETARAIALGR